MRKAFVAATVAMFLIFAGPAGATMALEVTDPGSGYTPDEPQDPILAGSSAVGECVGDVPWIDFSVVLTDPDGQSTGETAQLILTDANNAANTVTMELGRLVNNELSGRVLWPGASIDAEGNPTGWPGWAFVDGEWVETDGNFSWTRGVISAVIQVNPEVAVPLSYPEATPECATGPQIPSPAGSTYQDAGILPVTGMSAAVLPIAAVGALLAVVGGGFVLARRRTKA
jgi:LPXTG-motif cell wall-anchored protein